MDHPTREELEVLKDQRFLLIKQSLSNKVIAQLSMIERLLKDEIEKSNFRFPDQTFLKAGKISKGENYRSLPYYLLDYPRLFTHEAVFAYRTMLWWGNEFSCTLHIGGRPLDECAEKLKARLPQEKRLYFCISNNPWEYHFEESNYEPIESITVKTITDQINKHDFIKISDKISLDNWDQFGDFSLTTLKRFLKLID
ncbi:MAG: hypothetical protein ACFHWX_01265 [Bacteroidota bacterium]